MIRDLTIQNYKSILDHTIELGRFNVFIGENGCGKTNILEAVAMAGAALTGRMDVEELFARGIRVAKPPIMRSSFAGAVSKEITLQCGFDSKHHDKARSVELHIVAQEGSAADVRWFEEKGVQGPVLQFMGSPDGLKKLSAYTDAISKTLAMLENGLDAPISYPAVVELARSIAAQDADISSTWPTFMLELAGRAELRDLIAEVRDL